MDCELAVNSTFPPLFIRSLDICSVDTFEMAEFKKVTSSKINASKSDDLCCITFATNVTSSTLTPFKLDESTSIGNAEVSAAFVNVIDSIKYKYLSKYLRYTHMKKYLHGLIID